MDDEKKEYLKRMYQEKGFLHDHHKILAAENFELLKKFNDFVEWGYTNEGALNRKTKELLFITMLAVQRSPKEHIKVHINIAVKHGATKEEILEVLNLICLVDGAATYKYAFDAAKEVIPFDKIEVDL